MTVEECLTHLKLKTPRLRASNVALLDQTGKLPGQHSNKSYKLPSNDECEEDPLPEALSRSRGE